VVVMLLMMLQINRYTRILYASQASFCARICALIVMSNSSLLKESSILFIRHQMLYDETDNFSQFACPRVATWSGCVTYVNRRTWEMMYSSSISTLDSSQLYNQLNTFWQIFVEWFIDMVRCTTSGRAMMISSTCYKMPATSLPKKLWENP